MRRWLPWVGVVLLGCAHSGPPDVAATPTPTPAPSPTPGPSPTEDLVGLQDLPCAGGEDGCAAEGPYLEGTCCTFGDNLEYLASGTGAEVVDLETDGEHAWMCGGFGVRIADVTDPAAPRTVGAVAPRCQRIALGPVLDDGSKVFWLAHHGDSWVPQPFLNTYVLGADEGIVEVDSILDDEVLFEGLAWRDDRLYVAAHAGGVRTYRTGPNGTPTLQGVLGGFDNALKLAVDGDHLYVVDEFRLVVLSLTDPDAPAVVAEVQLEGKARDVHVDGGTAFLALGNDGVQTVDVSDPTAPVARLHAETEGSIQAVHTSGSLVAAAAWSHVALFDRSTLALLASDRTTAPPAFEQDLAVGMVGDTVLVGEWEGLHTLRWRQGYVGPQLWVSDTMLSFDAAEASEQTFEISNRGPLALEVTALVTDEPDRWTLDADALTVEPGASVAVTVAHTPVGAPGLDLLTLGSNDPSWPTWRLPLDAADGTQLDVGDVLPESFGFLDPTGANLRENLDGHVIVLAYFALF